MGAVLGASIVPDILKIASLLGEVGSSVSGASWEGRRRASLERGFVLTYLFMTDRCILKLIPVSGWAPH